LEIFVMEERMPHRIQRQRTKGWRMPDKRHAKYVGRPTVWGNPFKGPDAVERYRNAICGGPLGDRLVLERWLKDHGWEGGFDSSTPHSFLRGLHLICWCPLDQPCHADVLLELANTRGR
jgi:hypothetical protein